jgi:hypothetical protein
MQTAIDLYELGQRIRTFCQKYYFVERNGQIILNSREKDILSDKEADA